MGEYPRVELAINRYGRLKKRGIRIVFGPHPAHARCLTPDAADELATALTCYAEDARDLQDDSPTEEERSIAEHSKLPKCPQCGSFVIAKRDKTTEVVCVGVHCDYGSSRSGKRITIKQHCEPRHAD